MSIRVLKLITGEQIVGEVRDLKDDTGRGIGFEVHYPYNVVMRPINLENPGEPLKFDMNYLVWLPACKDNKFAIPYSSVIAFGDAAPLVVKAYLKNFGQELNEEGLTTS